VVEPNPTLQNRFPSLTYKYETFNVTLLMRPL